MKGRGVIEGFKTSIAGVVERAGLQFSGEQPLTRAAIGRFIDWTVRP